MILKSEQFLLNSNVIVIDPYIYFEKHTCPIQIHLSHVIATIFEFTGTSLLTILAQSCFFLILEYFIALCVSSLPFILILF